MITLEHLPAEHPGRALLTGRTIWFACKLDQRFSYGLYVPSSYTWQADLPIVVVVHSTNRDAQTERDTWADFAEEHQVIVFTPLFPAAIDHVDDLDSYKAIEYHGTRFDLILLSMLDEVAERWNADTRRFILAGHSGGAQFALRFLLLHPSRLTGVAVSAPGRITVIDDAWVWPRGVADLTTRFGIALAPRELSGVSVLLTAGDADLGTADLEAQNDPSQEGFGDSRVERLETLRENLEANRIDVTFTLVPESGHHGNPTLPVMQQFVAGLLP
ncbi:alpha/beta hydrolase [Subtercola lobariae]|uniref:Alpha/beta hydrolase n=1 Tax=Subtercola lobariae TaxID=1588641 RepID=A0A917F0H3_9MICO|nr:alpha/beta hydrolase [Subtercola lobariae]GGF30598.1 hypothetical protein GCM10011399_24810 [Subtercola lobariae]